MRIHCTFLCARLSSFAPSRNKKLNSEARIETVSQISSRYSLVSGDVGQPPYRGPFPAYLLTTRNRTNSLFRGGMLCRDFIKAKEKYLNEYRRQRRFRLRRYSMKFDAYFQTGVLKRSGILLAEKDINSLSHLPR